MRVDLKCPCGGAFTLAWDACYQRECDRAGELIQEWWCQHAHVEVLIARCPEHGLHGQREACFECGGPVEQVPMVLRASPEEVVDGPRG